MSNLYISKVRILQAFTTLQGLIEGISSDKIINSIEVAAIKHWLELNEVVINREPLRELITIMQRSLQDNILTQEELKDISFVCQNIIEIFSQDHNRTSNLQRLHGVVAGISVDGVLHPDEWVFLEKWIADNSNLKGSWPFDEIETLAIKHKSLANLTLDEKEMILYYFNDFCGFNGNLAITHPLNEPGKAITGICAVCPEVKIQGGTFCFTGESPKASKLKIRQMILKFGGEYKDGMSQQVDYLIVCSSGSPMWTYACYGRKVEEAIKLRKLGYPIQIIHEADFWDAMQEAA